jgi:hypothetical protein
MHEQDSEHDGAGRGRGRPGFETLDTAEGVTQLSAASRSPSLPDAFGKLHRRMFRLLASCPIRSFSGLSLYRYVQFGFYVNSLFFM